LAINIRFWRFVIGMRVSIIHRLRKPAVFVCYEGALVSFSAAITSARGSTINK
jgi:hypothetical protein